MDHQQEHHKIKIEWHLQIKCEQTYRWSVGGFGHEVEKEQYQGL